ncbi:hypothetical protein BOTBODRAFT_59835 [Botryobasidium botryosum FD-172 SS1]|uniref:Uncharacterized protein n=1 Tax=Botryobasidium botryosum (strain FD-172 SS1) TaxID=930990 RepID=A0A067M7Z3_BOTB1|nr:hypothetical protein BOTBODRAFT_59835 [Botryobasidium botryosum FD-172 SS1]
MYQPWNDISARESATTREFIIDCVEMWYSSKGALPAHRKVPPARKKNEKRDPTSQNLPASDETPRRLKERPSWASIGRVAYSAVTMSPGQWRNVTCKLTEENHHCVLNVYGEDNTLQHSIYIHLLRDTGIRRVDRSLFFRNDCLGIHYSPGQSLTPAPSEPIYLAFPSKEALSTWFVLLRSCAKPEIYGYLVAPSEGLYRMWRQCSLTIISSRNLGVTQLKPLEDHNTLDITPRSVGSVGGGEDGEGAVEIGLYCDILVDGEICGRTTVKKGSSSPYWHESFKFTDMPPFEIMKINLWKEKKLLPGKPTFLGTVEISLKAIQRGETIEGWFPAQSPNSGSAGEVHLKLKVDEVTILPEEAYHGVLEVLEEHNHLDLLNELEQKMRLEHIAPYLINIAEARQVFLADLCELAHREVEASSQKTLFRGNSTLTKVIEIVMHDHGRAFLEASIGSVVRRMIAENIALEIDPMKNKRGPKDIERNVELLVYWCKEFWSQIWLVRNECPFELRQLFFNIRYLVEKKYTGKENAKLRWQSVSAFCFLRFIVPAILYPHLFNICPGFAPVSVQRSLTLVAKVIQRLANLNTTPHKEEYMDSVKAFLSENVEAMIDYIIIVSTHLPETPWDGAPLTRRGSKGDYDQANITKSLGERTSLLSTLEREAVPRLPYILDLPRDLAMLASAVVRRARSNQKTEHQPFSGPRPMSANTQSRLEEFSLTCLEIDARASRHVDLTELKSPPRLLHRQQSQSLSISSPLRRPALDPIVTSQSFIGRSASTPPMSPAMMFVRRDSGSSIVSETDRARGWSKQPRPATAPGATSSEASETRTILITEDSPITFSRSLDYESPPWSPEVPTTPDRSPFEASGPPLSSPQSPETTPTPQPQLQPPEPAAAQSVPDQLPLVVASPPTPPPLRKSQTKGFLKRSLPFFL